MIHQKELRVGNFICLSRDKSVIKVIPQIISDVGDIIISGFYKPIPITEEWLEKLGFKNHGHYYTLDFRAGTIAYDGRLNLTLGFPPGGVSVIPEIKYVHQLQNLYFALAGKELHLKQVEQV